MDAPRSGRSNQHHRVTSRAVQFSSSHDMNPKYHAQDNTKLSSGQDLMCARCTNIRIEVSILLPCPPATRFITSLGEINDEMRHASCPLCRLFAAVYNPPPVRRRGLSTAYHLRAFESSHTSGPRIWPKHRTGALGVILGVCRGSSKKLEVNEEDRCQYDASCSATPRISARPSRC